MSELDPRSTLKRPPEKLVQKAKLSHIGDDTVRTFLTNGYSLAICCKDCPRVVEWTPPQLLERFSSKLDVGIAQLAERLSCSGEGGCGSHKIAVFPHLYDLPWSWCEPGEADVLVPQGAPRDDRSKD